MEFIQPITVDTIQSTTNNKTKNPFIEANTENVSLSHLRGDCVIPVFAKDNEATISHQEFIDAFQESTQNVFSGEQINTPDIRVSHIIKGRTPNAIYKSVNELLPEDKTIYYERMAFIIKIPSITSTINGNKLELMVGGVRAYNQTNLHSKKSLEKFKVFIGFQNMVCCNLCISTDGYLDELRVSDMIQLKMKLIKLFQKFNINNELENYKNLGQRELNESQFAQLIGKSKLYNYLSETQKEIIHPLGLSDSQISLVVKGYYEDKRFCKDNSNNLTLWNLYNLFTSANKSSYIDTFCKRNTSALNFTNSLYNALDNNEHNWYLE